MDTFAYVITVTPTGSLLVNGTPAAPTDGGSYTSDALLAWALDQVRQQWEVAGIRAGDDALLNVTIDDQRDGGYGRQKTRLRPGQAASIDALRARTGKNLQHWDPPIPEPIHQREPAQVPTYARQDAAVASPPASASTPPRNAGPDLADDAPTDAPPKPETAPAAATTTAQPSVPQAADQDQSVLPDESLHDQLTQQSEQQNAAKPTNRLSRFLAKKESSPPKAAADRRPAKPPRTRKPAARTSEKAASTAKADNSNHGGGSKIGLLSRKSRSEPDGTAAAEPAAAEPAADAPPHPGWTRYTPRVLRPRLPEAEKAAVKQRQSSPKTIMTVVATFVLALIAFVAWSRVSGAEQYVAVCVDQRTSARVNTDEPCVQNQAAYFRWWWVPDGSTVPAVGGQVDPQQGSFVEPDPEAPRTYGYAAQGGVYTTSG